MSIPPERMTDQQVITAMDSESPLNAARKIFRFRAAGMESARLEPIEQRRQEFETVLAIIDAFYGRYEGGLSSMNAFAIACGNHPFEDSKVCETCAGKGYVEITLPESEGPHSGLAISTASEAQRPAEAVRERLR